MRAVTTCFLLLVVGEVTSFRLSRFIGNRRSGSSLLAKKKGASKFVSDDFLASIDEQLEGITAVTSEVEKGNNSENMAGSVVNTDIKADAAISSPSKKKKGKKAKFSFDEFSFDDDVNSDSVVEEVVDDTLPTVEITADGIPLIVEDSTSSTVSSNKKKKGKKAKFSFDSFSFDGDETEDTKDSAEVDVADDAITTEESELEGEDEVDEPSKQVFTDGLTVEQRQRGAKPKSRIRFAENSQPDFVMMSLDHVSLIYGNEIIIKDSTLSVSSGQRVGLVGPNGGGKTTQLKILYGDLEPTTGDVVKSSKDLRVAMLRQEFIDELVMDRTLRDELLSSFEVEQKLLKDIAACEEEVGRTTDNPERMEVVLNSLQDLQDKAISMGAYALESKVDKIMDATGFSVEDGRSLVRSFSGGWKMRIGLAKILLKEPNILLLDEPTNHLDLDSVYWLEDFLIKQTMPMVIVSHDREFLDRVCNRIVDVEDGVTVAYEGNYSNFIAAKINRIDTWKEKYDRQVRHIKEEEKWIKKAKNDPFMAQQVKDKEMQLEAFKNSPDRVESPPKDKKFRFRFPPSPRCGELVVEGSKLTHGYGEGQHKVLFQDVEFQVQRRERVGFVGPNGSGKSTLMRIIAGRETPKSGFAEFGNGNVEANYFAQNQADEFDLELTVLETLKQVAPSDYSLTDIRTLLGQFMFKGDDVDKKLKVLSGGEKARVALCTMMLSPANLLLLDEPTNHLDITAKEVLEDALQHYEGSVLIISHDRYFMSQTANRIFHFHNKTVTRHDCDYHDFMNAQDGLKEKVFARTVAGDRFKITNAKEPVIIENVKSKKNFGGSGVTSGNLFKGIKNAKRFQN